MWLSFTAQDFLGSPRATEAFLEPVAEGLNEFGHV